MAGREQKRKKGKKEGFGGREKGRGERGERGRKRKRKTLMKWERISIKMFVTSLFQA